MYIQYNGLSILYYCKRSSDNYVNEVSSGHLSMKQKHASRVKRWEDAGELLPDPEIPVQHSAIYCTYLQYCVLETQKPDKLTKYVTFPPLFIQKSLHEQLFS